MISASTLFKNSYLSHHLGMDKYVHNYPALQTSAQLDESLHITSDHPLNSHLDNVTTD